MVPTPRNDCYLPPTAESDLKEFQSEIMEALNRITPVGGQGIKGVTIVMDALWPKQGTPTSNS